MNDDYDKLRGQMQVQKSWESFMREMQQAQNQRHDLQSIAAQQAQGMNPADIQQMQQGQIKAMLQQQMAQAMQNNNVYATKAVCKHGMLRKICEDIDCMAEYIHEE